jgi:MFS family permease
MRWLLGFILHKIAFGLLSVLLPLYITQAVSGGTLAIWGAMTATATFLAIPFSFMWGYICDAANRYSIFILLSFSAVTVLLFIFSQTTDLLLIWLLFALIAVFQVAYETPKNVLIAETSSYEYWKKGFALYAVWTELGWVLGLLLGLLLGFLGFSYISLLSVSVILSLLSFISSIFLVRDPVMIFERRFRRIEKAVSLVQKGAILLSRSNLTSDDAMALEKEKIFPFCTGLVLFSLATSIFFVPLPVYFARVINLETGIVFGLFLLNSLGCLFGYAFTLRNHHSLNPAISVKNATLGRSLLILSAFLIGSLPFFGAITLSIVALVSMGLAYAFYSICVLSISMDIIPKGKAGLFSALIGVGSAIGCFVGPIIAESFGFQYIFLISSLFCFLSFLAFQQFA